MRRVLLIVAIVMMAITACAPGVAATEEPSVSIDEPTPTHIPVDLTPAQRAAINALMEQLSLSADKIKLVSTEAVTWPDGCLGIVRMGVMCQLYIDIAQLNVGRYGPQIVLRIRTARDQRQQGWRDAF